MLCTQFCLRLGRHVLWVLHVGQTSLVRSTRYKNEFDFVDVATEFELDLKEREFCCQVKFLGSRQPVTYNVLELKEVRLWNTIFSTYTIFISCRNTVLFFAYINIMTFPIGTTCRQKTYTSARIFFRCC